MATLSFLCSLLWWSKGHCLSTVNFQNFATQGLHFFPPLTLPRSCCSSIWMSVSLLLSSSLVACTESAITSDLSGFLPFLKGGATEGVVDDIALQPPNQDGHRVPGVAKRRRKSVAAPPPCKALHHHHHVVVKPTSLLEAAESFYLREKGRQTERKRQHEKRESQC